MIEDFSFNKNPYLNYEYVLLNIVNDYNVGFEKIDDLVWTEIDGEEHYKNLKYVIFPKLQRKEIKIKTYPTSGPYFSDM